MTAKRRFELLNEAELRHLMQLVFDGSVCADEDQPALNQFLGVLVADVSFELWLREQARARLPGGARVH